MRIPGTSIEVVRDRPAPRRSPGPARAFGTPSTTLNAASTTSLGKDAADVYEYLVAGGPDVNPDLVGRQKFALFREMAITDPACRSLLWMFSLPARSAAWGLTPAATDPDGPAEAERRAEWAAYVFGLEGHHTSRLDLSWDEGLVQKLFFQRYGSMGEELVWADAEEWESSDGTPYFLRPLARLAPRFPATIERIDIDPKTGWIKEIEQDLPDAKPIPGSKLAWYVLEREGANWYGTSLLRSCIGAFLLKKQKMIAEGIAYERWAGGIPIIRHPPGRIAEGKAEATGRELRSHERAWIALSGPPPEYGGEWDAKVLTGTIADAAPMLHYYDQQIAVSGLQQFSTLGTTQHGSRAVAETISDPYYLAVQATANYIAEIFMKRILRPLWTENFGPKVPIPALTVSKIQGKNIAVLARALADLTSAGMTFTDRAAQDDLRDILDLPHLPDAVADAISGLPADVGVAAAPGVKVVTAVEGGPAAT